MKNFQGYIEQALEPLVEDQRAGTWCETDTAFCIFSDNDSTGIFAAGWRKRIIFSIADAMRKDDGVRSLIHAACKLADGEEKRTERPKKFLLGDITKKLTN